MIAIYPTCHCSPIDETHREFDKVHYELAYAALKSFWCGCLPRMKENRNVYLRGTTASMGNILQRAFQMGTIYAPMEENKRKNKN